MINSIESERLERLIKRKTASYNKMKAEDPENPALKFLNSEITFLRDDILPIILTNTTVDYSEIRDYVTRCMRKLENHPAAARTATDMLIHFHLKEAREDKKPIVVCFSNIGHQRQFVADLFVDNREALSYPL